MRIGFYFPALNYGGHEEVACKVINLLTLTYEIDIYCSKNNDVLIKKIGAIDNFKNINLHRQDIKNNIGFSRYGFIKSVLDFISLLRALKKNKKLDRLIFIDGGFGASLITPLAPRLCGVQVISYLPLFQKKIENSIIVKIYSIIFLNKIITINKLIEKRLEGSVKCKILVVNNPITSSNYYPAVRVLPIQKRILFLGRIDLYHKQQDKFIKFVVNNSDYFKDFIIDIYGDGVERDILIDHVKNSDLQNIRIMGWKMWDRNFSLYAATILYSKYEGEPVVFVDSIMNDTPVICPEELVDVELVPKKFTFRRDDIESFKNAINNAISDKIYYKKIKEDLVKNREEKIIKNQWIEALK
jgi:glycosyltransferase involved in cell wall biosynthesis